ncbi:hypothetical protein FOVG_13808 [Fusarium oxysporum f. sp. pisi HDV247]|uniref:Uncharacterized protein n=1 Tax=Fusarium oxysporum f. sp. pisi HDV247 TaxID=1080344 RepID=W9NWG0_FUSOX|nr:hypothetical protein FOVG_13808 [Fusarium oxysporum f. sp. pisi HDV247]
MVESTNAERLDYLWEMALAIHGGIIEHLDEDHELDKPLIAHLNEVDHFTVVKKGLQSRRIDQASDNDNQLAGGDTTPPRSHQSPLTIGHVNNQSISPPSHRSTASPSLFGSSPEPQYTRSSAPALRKVARRIPGESRNSKALREMRRAVPYASWVDNPK